MKLYLHLFAAAMLVALAVGDADADGDADGDLRIARSPQLDPFSAVAGLASGIQRGIRREQRRQLRREQRRQERLIGGLGGLGGLSGSRCRYWCRTPEGAAYCCENTNQPINPIAAVVFKPGQCPPVRPVCPRLFGATGPPVTCSSDGSCPGVDKCCFDRCLGEHVCKAPRGFGR